MRLEHDRVYYAGFDPVLPTGGQGWACSLNVSEGQTQRERGPAEKVGAKRTFLLFCSRDTYIQACLQTQPTKSHLSDLNDFCVVSEQRESFRRKPTYMLLDFQWQVLVHFILLFFLISSVRE